LGVAISDWSDEDLRHAREAIVAGGEPLDLAVFDRFAARLSCVAGDLGAAATYERVAAAIKGPQRPVFCLEIPLSCSAPSSRGSPKRDSPTRRASW
jgi:glucose-6-phosphate 1-dehydrogenase